MAVSGPQDDGGAKYTVFCARFVIFQLCPLNTIVSCWVSYPSGAGDGMPLFNCSGIVERPQLKCL